MQGLSPEYTELPPAHPPSAGESGEGPDLEVTADPDSIGALVSRLSEQVARLAREEIALARVEAKQQAKKAGTGAGLFGVSGMLAYFGTCCAVAAAILGLCNLLRPWSAALAVAILLFLVAGALALPGLLLLKRTRPAAVIDSVTSLKSDVAAVRARWSSRGAHGDSHE